MTSSRRDFLKGCGALFVCFSATPLVGPASAADTGQGPFETHASHIDPTRLDSWLAVGSDGTITAHTGKCDFGQGMYTAQTQLIAEELCVPISRVKLIECDTAVTPDQGTTSGSQSTPANFNHENLALAAATARQALLALAATRIGVPVEELTAEEGVIHGPGGQALRYEELIGTGHLNIPLDKQARRIPQSQWKVLGKPILSLDRVALMTGTFEFVHYVRVAGMVHARVVRPPGMGWSVAHIDESSVRALPGFIKVVRRQDLVGVVAETQYAAMLAARKLSVQWNPGPPLPEQSRFYEHLQHGQGGTSTLVDSGNVNQQLGAAKQIVRAQYRYPFQMHGSVGASCAVADVRPDAATVWSPTQSAYPTRSIVAKLLNLPPDSVRVIYTRGSGCYGLNGADAVSFEAAIFSQEVGRPVRLQYSREDEMKWENLGAACVIEHRAALDESGRVVAWDRENWVASLGNRPGYDQPGNVITGMLLGYTPEKLQDTTAKQPEARLRNQSNAVPNYMAGCVGGNCGGQGVIHAERVVTHTVPSPFFTGPLRSPMRIQNTFANECFMDELAANVQADPVEFRLRHVKEPRLAAVIQAAAKAAGWKSRPLGKPATVNSGVVTGYGIAALAYEGENGFAALVAEVEVNLADGQTRPKRFVLAIDCGPVSNPDGLRNQIEGSILQGMSRTLLEEVTWDEKSITSTDWVSYRSFYLDCDVPAIETVLMNPEGVRALGAGETAITVVPAAIGNAIFDATGVRLRELPFTPERFHAARSAAPNHNAERA